jgi:hypothetical protein
MNARHDMCDELSIPAAEFHGKFCMREGNAWFLPHLRMARAEAGRI